MTSSKYFVLISPNGHFHDSTLNWFSKSHENVVFNIDGMGIMNRNALIFAPFQDSITIS